MEFGPSSNAKSVIRVTDLTEAFVRVLESFKDDEREPRPGIGPGAVIEEDAEIGAGVSVGPNCYIGFGASVGDGCVVFPNVYIGDGVRIGAGTRIYPGVTIYRDCTVGSRVILHAGTVIGADGFGYRPGCSGLVKFPHIGTVRICDDVEIGANSAVDRAKTGATVIGKVRSSTISCI